MTRQLAWPQRAMARRARAPLRALAWALAWVSASAVVQSAEGTCSTAGECTDSRVKTFWVHNNGLDEGVQVTRAPPIDIAALEEDLGELVGARDTLLPHQREYGFGESLELYTALGIRVKEWEQVSSGDTIYVVPSGLLFMWPGVKVGHTVTVDDIKTLSGDPIRLRTISLSPRLFEIENLLTGDEAEALRMAALKVDHGGNRFQRSTTGHQGNVDPFRTSDNAFIHSESEISLNLTKRAFESIRVPYDPALGDGIQVLRYNKSGGYRWHTDWFPEHMEYGRNHDVTRGGANRFATVFFYLSDVELGGQTGFPEAQGDTSELDSSMALAKEMFSPHAWELEAVEKCFGRLSVKPAKAKAILFYSLHPNGKGDPMSMHTGCPVLKGEKWAANLWIWNKNRDEKKGPKTPIIAEFVNKLNEPCQVSWVTNPRESQGEIQPGQSIIMNTYDSDSFVFRDLSRTRVIFQWTADIQKGEKQVIEIIQGAAGDLETASESTSTTTGEIKLILKSEFDSDLDVYWAGDRTNTLTVLRAGQMVNLNTFHGHSFLLFRLGDRETIVQTVEVDGSKGSMQKIRVAPDGKP